MASGYQPGSPGHVLITGASSGIGAALALHYAAPRVRLGLQGRDAARLAAVADACRARGAEVATALLDVTDRDACATWAEAADDAAPVDLAIANAGISGTEDPRRAVAVNVHGVLNTVEPLLPRMTGRRHGQVALMSSLASFRGTPQAAAYCASKAAVRVWGEGLRPRLLRQGVLVNVVCPGFVTTPMTAVNRFPMPMIMPAEQAAAIIARGLARDRPRIAFPLPMYLGVRLFAAMPQAFGDRLVARYRGKE
jgi:short-subunit dehydrogenase